MKLEKIIPLTVANPSPLFQNSELLQQIQAKQKELSFLVGFDGFIDEIVTCIDKRSGPDNFQPMKEMKTFASRLLEASGKSCNVELVTMQQKIGGNAPILAEALVQQGSKVALIGALGLPEIHPLFHDLYKKCVYCKSIANAGHTDALEFSDGKILLGKLSSLLHIDAPLLVKQVGKKKLTHLIDQADLFACTNWTMISHMTEIWKFLNQEIFPKISKKKRWFFVDLADPAKRSDKDLIEALITLQAMQPSIRICLGLNQAESERIATLFRIQTPHLCEAIRQKLSFEQVVIHTTRQAIGASRAESICVDGPYCSKPLFTTGGGDNFNAGYCLALACDLPLQEALLLGCYTSGYYVRHGKSPALEDIFSKEV